MAPALAPCRSLPDIRAARPLLLATPSIRASKDRFASTCPAGRPWGREHGKHFEFQRTLYDCDKQTVQQLKRLHKAFPFQSYVEGSENRGVTIEQLLRVHRFAMGVCAEWGRAFDEVDFHDVSRWVLSPTTKSTNSAFYEHLAKRKQSPNWFISHWWGGKVATFARCIQKHMATRDLCVSTVFWICAYALRQNALRDDVGASPCRSAFYKAMEAARFKLLLVLDAETGDGGPATPSSRIWCCFECAVCLGNQNARMDIVTCNAGEVAVVTDGLTQQEQTCERYRAGVGLAAKTARERAFPLAIVEAGLQWDRWDVRKARATEAEDRGRILNSLAARDLDAEPEREHERYGATNLQLRSAFAQAFIRWALASGAPQEVIEELVRTIPRDTQRTWLRLNVAGCDLGDPQRLRLALGCLAPKLESLDLNLSRTGIGDSHLKMLADDFLPTTLTTLILNLDGCEGITSGGVTAFTDRLPPKLRRLDITVTRTGVADQHSISFRGTSVSEHLAKQTAMADGAQEVRRKHVPGSAYALWS